MAQVLPSWREFIAFIDTAVSWIAGTFFKLTSLAIVVLVLVLVLRDLNRDVAIIQPIAVPKALADSGYTPEVAGDRLRDALDALQRPAGAEPESSIVDDVNAANSILAHTATTRDQLPDFVVPQIGLSLNAIVSSIRSLAHYSNGGQVISGELIYRDHYALRMRVDGKEVFNSGFESDNPDDLLDRAAPAVALKLWPAFGASVLYRTNPDQALRDADDIIATRAESDPNVPRAYYLKGEYYAERERNGEAEKMFRKAISLHLSDWSVYNRLGVALQRQGNFHDALEQFQRVVDINPKSADGYINIGAALVQIAQLNHEPDQAKLDQARKNYERAIALKPQDTRAHNNLGLLWNLQKKRENAIDEFAQVIRIDPNYLYGHWNLAADLVELKQVDKALEQYRLALDCTQAAHELALLHIHIGNALKSRGASSDLDAAIAEYRVAVETDPFYAWPHNSLGEALRDQGKLDDAIAEFHAALHSDDTDNNKAINAAKENLEQTLQVRTRQPGALQEEAQAATK